MKIFYKNHCFSDYSTAPDVTGRVRNGRYFKCFCCIILMLFLISADSYAMVRRMIGPNVTMSWASSYLAIESGNITVQDNASWTYATATGWFFDALFTPYISLRMNWFFYPTPVNSDLRNVDEHPGEIPLHEIGFSVCRHFNAGPLNPWFGAGPYVQFATVDDINSYIVHILLSVGFDYEITDDVYLCPQLLSGLGMKIVKSEENSVVVDVPTGKNFSTSGIVIFLKLGVGKVF